MSTHLLPVLTSDTEKLVTLSKVKHAWLRLNNLPVKAVLVAFLVRRLDILTI
jgi:hypothetical protein